MRGKASLIGCFALLALACVDFRTPGDLRYARVLAVRATPPRIAPGERARIELLVTGDDGVVAVQPPVRVALATPQPGRPAPPPETAALIVQEGDAWYVNAPGEAELVAARGALGLPADAPIPLPLETRAILSAQERVAEKIVLLGGQAANPAIAGVTVNGMALADTAEALIPAAGDVVLSGAAVGEGQLSFAWFTGFGKVEKYLQPVATLREQKAGDHGALVLVVRDEHGGVTWQLASLRVP